MRWDGSDWSRVRNNCGYGLYGLTAFGTDDVWAVGGQSSCHWNGQRWTAVPIDEPYDPKMSVDLNDVDGVSSDDLWAVGTRFSQCGEGVCSTGEIQHYDGSNWSEVSTPAPPLDGVVAIAADDVWAVGHGGVSIWHYNGASWREVPPPDLAGDGQASLTSVDAIRPGRSLGGRAAAGGSPDGASLVVHARAFDSGAVVGGTGVSDAVVSWFGPETGSVETDPTGRYQIGGLDVGAYTFIVTSHGCAPTTREVAVRAGQNDHREHPARLRSRVGGASSRLAPLGPRSDQVRPGPTRVCKVAAAARLSANRSRLVKCESAGYDRGGLGLGSVVGCSFAPVRTRYARKLRPHESHE